MRHVRNNPKDTYIQVIKTCGLSCKKRTVTTILEKYYITKWRAARRPFLTETNVLKRLAWCLVQKGWAAEEWGLYI